MLRFLAAAIAAPLLLTAADCRTPFNTPCFTLRYTRSIWAFVKSPAREFIKSEHKGVLAVRADGSMASLADAPDRFAIRDRRQPSGRAITLFLAPENRVIRHNIADLDDFRHVPLIWDDRPFRRAPEGDTTCAAVARGLEPAATADGKATLHGQPVTRWKYKHQLVDVVFSLAPAIDCQVLSYSRLEYRYRYIPVRHETFEATGVSVGDPDAALFTPPALAKETRAARP